MILSSGTLIIAPAPSASFDSDLAPYKQLARSPAAARLLAIARDALKSYWAAAPAPDTSGAPEWPGPPSGVYISLTHGRETRACVGSAAPTRATLAATLRMLAIESLRADRRRPPIRREELDELRIVIAFTDAGESVANPMSVDPARDGLLVTSPRGAIAFLPGEARTVRWALAEARRVGILDPRARDASYRRLSVVSLSEPPRATRAAKAPDASDD